MRRPPRARARLASGVLLAGSLAASLALAELVLRVALDEVDYLQPRLVPHPTLDVVIAPGSGAHDAWGFRNGAVPERVDVLAIGDSQTYGVSATARESWPAQLARRSGRSVYNLALGGYGPPDYEQLFEAFGRRLGPEVVVVGFYAGNDLLRAEQVARGAPRTTPADLRADPRWLGAQRTWLSQHSLLYQVAKHELPALANALRRGEAAVVDDPGSLALEHLEVGTYLTPELRLAVIDPGRPRNRRGLEATEQSFAALHAAAAARGASCWFVLIPTKESVYGALAPRALPDADAERVARVVRAEAQVRDALVAFFDAHGMRWVDPLPRLREQVERRRLYHANADGHPNGAGYGVIAEAVADALADDAPPSPRGTPGVAAR